jgi:hypothetical protein
MRITYFAHTNYVKSEICVLIEPSASDGSGDLQPVFNVVY